jgi:hypothetical protein
MTSLHAGDQSAAKRTLSDAPLHASSFTAFHVCSTDKTTNLRQISVFRFKTAKFLDFPMESCSDLDVKVAGSK